MADNRDWLRVPVTIRARGMEPVEINLTRRRLRRLALHWDYLMRNRSRWIEDESLRSRIEQRAREHLRAVGISETFLASLARSECVEVSQDSFPGGEADRTDFDIRSNQDTRRMPWEGLLTMATKKYRNHERVLVIRRLVSSSPAPAGKALEFLPNALFVESAPGNFHSAYNWDFEYAAVATYLEGLNWTRLRNPSLGELTEQIRTLQPVVVHMSCIDGYQGFQLLKAVEAAQSGEALSDPASSQPLRPQEGVYFRDEYGQPVVKDPETVAAALTPQEHKPLLVTFNQYNSSARLASATVDQGAFAAVGIQDFTDDTVAEIFFANLFSKWSHGGGSDLREAFGYAVGELAAYAAKVRGSGVALWTSASLLEDATRQASCIPARGKETKAEKDWEFDVEPYAALNYSILHNSKRQIFEIFRIYKFRRETIGDVRVEVILQMGSENFSFRGTFEMRHHILDLSERIAVGLTSTLSRSLRESVRTTVFVRITLGQNRELYASTFDVSLLAVDEWKDDPVSGVFLPSFILPRDPLVPQVITASQRYLKALADDATQGFDGYQSYDKDADDPSAGIEVQVRAIWYALQHDFALNYINPPPTFSAYSQRLRTPTDVLKGGRGTCIDLALILAACLEYIGLDPVIFLLKGHCFAGYWNHEQGRDDFLTVKNEPLLSSPDEPTPLPSELEQADGESYSQVPPIVWQFDERRRQQIVDAVERGDLVALEATYLTNGGSFYEAVETGTANLRDPEEFESMIEVTLAREKGVTPLPLVMDGSPR